MVTPLVHLLQRRVAHALFTEGYKYADLTPDQKARADAPRRGLHGRALVAFIVDDKGLVEQVREAQAHATGL